MRSALFVLAVVSLPVLAGCGVRPAGEASRLPGTTWLVDRIVEPDGSVRRGTGETVGFGADGRIALSSCNLCSGPYEVSRAGVLTLAPALACTRRGCAEGATELEREIVGPLQVRRDGEYLVLDGGAGGRQILLLPDPEAVGAAGT